MHRTLAAADTLASDGISVEVLDFPTLKPLDAELLCASARKTARLVTVEDHNAIGGLGSAASEALLAAGVGPRFRALGVQDVYTESGPTERVREKYGVGQNAIVWAVRDLLGKG